jgi:hypothetical protein
VSANGNAPSTAASSTSVRSGRRLAALNASSTTPARANRMPAPSSAGLSSRPILIETQVLDQITTSSP